MNLTRAIATLSGYTMLSRVAGFVRDVLHTSFLGASPVSDAFIVAFRVPNFFRRLFAEGALTAAFVPLFSGVLATEGEDKAFAFAEQVLSWLSLVLFFFVIVFEIFMPQMMVVLAPGFVHKPEQFAMVVEFSRYTFPYLFFISVSAVYGGVLNSFGKFAISAFSPVLLNLCMITALLGFHTLSNHALGGIMAISIMIAGAVQFLWFMLALRKIGRRLSFIQFKMTPLVKAQLKRMGPAALSGSVYQINMLLDSILATFLIHGAVSYLYFADRIAQLPLGVIGVAIGTALLPMISKQLNSGETLEANTTINRSFEFAFYMTLPAAIALLVLAEPIVANLFGRGEFTAEAVNATALTIMAFSVGIPATVLNKVFVAPYYAHGDTKTPFKISVFAVALNFVMNLILMYFFSYVGLALSMSLSAWAQLVLLVRGLYKRQWMYFDDQAKYRGVRIFMCAAFMAIYLAVSYQLLKNYATTSFLKIVFLGVYVGGGLGVYFLSSQLTKAFTWAEFKLLIRRNKA